MNIATSLRGLPKRFVSEGLLDEATALSLLQRSEQEKSNFIKEVVTSHALSAKVVAEIASDEYSTPLYDLSVHNPQVLPTEVVDPKLVRKHMTLPLYTRGNRLFVGTYDPTNNQAISELRFQSGLAVDTVVVEYDKLEAAIEQYLSKQGDAEIDTALGDLEGHLDNIDIESQKGDDDDVIGADSDDAPIVRFINKLLIDAIRTGASDIHFEPYEKNYRVRYRTDGILQEVTRPPNNLAPRLAARLKVMSQLDISERRVPQDGRIKVRLSKNKAIDFRVSTLPTLYGEKIVLRVLDPASAQLGIEALGYEDDQREAYTHALGLSQGMILVTGPTGSGKTVSLYTGLNILNTAERNISTAEDPVEINLEGINQVQVHPRVGLNFANALRAFLRQDPDVIMVGEIRDLETAEIAIKAAQTGHLVLSTLHTNSAPETLTRLLNMGVPAFNVATSVNLIMAQRLARRLCTKCRRPADDIPDQILTAEGFDQCGIPREEMTLFHAVGCAHCSNGYKGRVGIYEVLRITPTIQTMIMEGSNSLEIAKAAHKEGFRNLRTSALRKAAWGMISLEEANRITKD